MVPTQLILALLLAGANCIQCQQQEDNNKTLSFVDFPKNLEPRLRWEMHEFISDDDEREVEFRVFQIFPEPPEEDGLPSQRIWPVLEGMTARMDGIMWPRVHYYMERGEEYECRAPMTKSESETDNTKATTTFVPVKSDHCDRHCTHGGRYCSPQIDSLPDGKHGKDVIHEALRRMCIDNHYHTTDGRFFRYLEYFDQLQCFSQNSDTRTCSQVAMKMSGMDHDNLEKCLAEDSWDSDVPHEILERNMYHFTNTLFPYSRDKMPQIELNGIPIMPDDYGKEIRIWSPEFIFGNYCNQFPHDKSLPHEGQPLACEVCSSCQDIGTCLFTLECDGVPFDNEKWVSKSLEKYPNMQQDTPTNSVVSEGASPAIEEEGEGSGGRIFLVILLVVCVAILPVGYVYYRKRHHDLQLSNILDSVMGRGDYHDESYSYTGKNPVPNWKVGRSVRNGEDSNISPHLAWDLEAELNDIAIDGEIKQNAYC